jgi:hypothetical protein
MFFGEWHGNNLSRNLYVGRKFCAQTDILAVLR